MSNLNKALVLLVVIVLIGFGLVVWKKKVGGASHDALNSISASEIEMLLSDVAKSNPGILKRLKDDPGIKKQQLDSFRQLFAFASAAQRSGIADDPVNRQELQNIEIETAAGNYDKELHKDSGPMPPYGFISEEQINQSWGDTSVPGPRSGFAGFMDKLGLGEPADNRTHEAEFEDFLNCRISLLKAANPQMKDREISDDERQQARDYFARTRIYYKEYKDKVEAGEIGKDVVARIGLQTKLQKAQFLARLFSETQAPLLQVTDAEIDDYIAKHPELGPDSKRTKAEEVLARAKNGEDFAALANENSDDPGNKGADGQPQGGLYKDVPKGRMVAPFEQAALSLEPGQVAPEIVPTDFGFHIIKLERKLGKSDSKDSSGETYDVRHILISTMMEDPDRPGRQMPVKDFVRGKLEDEKSKALLDKLVAENGVSVPDDFEVPELTEEQIQQMNKRQMPQQMPQGDLDDAAPGSKKPDAKKPEAKKPEGKKK